MLIAVDFSASANSQPLPQPNLAFLSPLLLPSGLKSTSAMHAVAISLRAIPCLPNSIMLIINISAISPPLSAITPSAASFSVQRA